MPTTDPLKRYREKRNFAMTPEPQDGGEPGASERSFVIQKHWASHLHYDFRLELDGAMKSWAVPKGPSLDSKVKRMAVEVEDHPIAYNRFEGEIPEKQYGAGTVIIWDRGTWTPIGDPRQGYRDGNLKFMLDGEKLQGKWALIRMKGDAAKPQPWLLIKEKDAHGRPESEYQVTEALPDSVMQSAPAVRKAAGPARKSPAAESLAAALDGRPAAATAGPAAARSRKKAVAGASEQTAVRVSLPAAAVKAALPARFTPELATLVAEPPGNADDWLYEIKFDGYRLLARVDGDDVTLVTRNGNDWTDRMPHLVAAVHALDLGSAWLDGEIVVADSVGLPDFQALQNAFDGSATQDIVYYVFDLPYHAGHDLTSVPLQERRALLQALLEGDTPGAVRYSQAFDLPVGDLLASSCSLGLEGVIGKRKDSGYAQRRSGDWIKVKCSQRQEFVIGGYTDPKGARRGFGSLLLGVHDASGALRYAGNVGTGFTEDTLEAIHDKLTALAVPASPFSGKTGIDRSAHWVQPRLLAEVAFAGWTGADRLRHPVFHGLRTDKPARNILRERPVSIEAAEPDVPAAPEPARGASKPTARTRTTGKASAGKARPAALPPRLGITHPDKVIDTASGTTKLALVEYHALVAPLIMPHLKHRPVALVRAPDGIGGPLFFQKHADNAAMAGVDLLDPALDPGHARLLEVVRPEGLLSAAQRNVIEFHTWNALDDMIEKPDRMTFDLDPGEGVAWSSVRESAALVRELLSQLGLQSFLKTSGGKGLHVVVPLQRRHDWGTVKDFSHAIVDHLADVIPQRFVSKSGPANRVGKLFVDYLRNGRGATTACAWSARSRPGIGISVPVAWEELDDLSGGAHWTIGNIADRIAIGNTPWDGYAGAAQTLTAAMKKLGFRPGKPSAR